MTATPSQSGTINRAAALLGSTQRVVSIEDDGNLAKHAREHWDPVLRLLLADHPWNFAIRRAVLNEAEPAPEFGWDRAFTLPADCLRWLPPDEDEADYYEAVTEGNDLLLTNAAAPLPVRYVSSELGYQINRWRPHFETAMAYALAEVLAEPITQSASVAQTMGEKAEYWLKRAKRADAMESRTQRQRNVERRSRWLGAARRPYAGRV